MYFPTNFLPTVFFSYFVYFPKKYKLDEVLNITLVICVFGGPGTELL